MKVKERIIRIEKINQGDCLIVDEYGIEDGEIYHRNITINGVFS